jgi:hypothetical protein
MDFPFFFLRCLHSRGLGATEAVLAGAVAEGAY